MHIGVMKLIGETIKEGQYLVSDGTKMRRGLKAIGLASWGYTANNMDLINGNPMEFSKVPYNSNVEIKRNVKPPLDPNHTHFFLIDHGKNNKFYEATGISNFINDFEKMLRDPAPRGLDIPIITLLLEGGTDAIYKVKDSLELGQPCVIVEGSGRAADILAYGYREWYHQT